MISFKDIYSSWEIISDFRLKAEFYEDLFNASIFYIMVVIYN